MARRTFQDIKKTKKKVNRALSPDSKIYTTQNNKHEEDKHKRWSSITNHSDLQLEQNASSPRFTIWMIAFISVVALFVSIFSLFDGATVKITPRNENGIIDGVFSAYKNANEGQLQYDTMVLSVKKSKDVPATEERKVQRKASGDIIVYNTYSSRSQRLIKNTRFMTLKGRIYRIKESIVVPGTTVVGGKKVPGSVEAKIYADEPGKEYNIGLSDFKIPGFKGGPRYDGFYARSKTKIENGFTGTMKFPTDEKIAEAKQEIKQEIRKQLLEDVKAQKPKGYVLYNDGIYISFIDNSAKLPESTGGKITITESGVLRGIIFDKFKMASFIASKASASYDKKIKCMCLI